MAIILDADVIIHGEKGNFDLRRWLAARPDEEFEEWLPQRWLNYGTAWSAQALRIG